MKTGIKRFLSTTHILLISFLAVILIGTALLSLPISTADGKGADFSSALFTATTSTCVTGLVVETTASYWSTFGHIVILLLIQIGGLGVITVMTAVAVFMHKKLGLSDSILIRDAFNLQTMSGLVSFIKKVLAGTFIVEGVGALLYMIAFVPRFGAVGIWYSVFTSVSAFCNAGIDIMGADSFCSFSGDPLVNAVTMLLIIVGGIGYIVWWDVIRVIKNRKGRKTRLFKGLTLHSKIAVVTTAVLVIGGALLTLLFEYNNPATMQNMSVSEKLLASLFQSVTTRTAGFASIPQENLTDSTALLSMLLMFIGGSPVGTAGGIKTVTVTVFIAVLVSTIRDKNQVNVFGRALSEQSIRKAAAVCTMSFMIFFLSSVSLCYVSDARLLDVLYESVSATATVGLTRDLTAHLNEAGRYILIATMYLGRVGPISLALAMNIRRKNKNLIKNPVEEISIG